MARLTKLWTAEPTTDPKAIVAFLGEHQIDYARWEIPTDIADLAAKTNPSDDDKSAMLEAFRGHLDRLAQDKGYIDADVVCIRNVEGIDAALAKFDKVHYHDDDEVRAIVGGKGVFGFIGDDGRQFLVEVEAGDYVSVPAGMWHWFYCDTARNITALRLFKDTTGWVPHYRSTERGPATGIA